MYYIGTTGLEILYVPTRIYESSTHVCLLILFRRHGYSRFAEMGNRDIIWNKKTFFSSLLIRVRRIIELLDLGIVKEKNQA